MHDERQWGQATKGHPRRPAGRPPTTRALNTPIYETTTFAYEDMASYECISAAALGLAAGQLFLQPHPEPPPPPP